MALKQLFPGLNRTDTHKSSQRLCQHAPDLYRFKSGRTPAPRREDGHKVPPLTNNLFSIGYLMGKGKEVLFNVVSQVYGSQSRASPMARGSFRFFCFVLVFYFIDFLFQFVFIFGLGWVFVLVFDIHRVRT